MKLAFRRRGFNDKQYCTHKILQTEYCGILFAEFYMSICYFR